MACGLRHELEGASPFMPKWHTNGSMSLLISELHISAVTVRCAALTTHGGCETLASCVSDSDHLSTNAMTNERL